MATAVKQARMEEEHAVLSTEESQIEKAIEELDEHVKKEKQITQDAMQLYDRVEDLVKRGRMQLTKLAQTADSDSEESARKVRTDLLSLKGRLTTYKEAATDLNLMTSAMEAGVGDVDCSALLSPSAVAMTTLVIDKEAMSRVESSLQELGGLKLTGPSFPFFFHSNHGQNVLLTDDGRVAERQEQHLYGIVISSQPMETNHMYEVEVKSLSRTAPKGVMLILPGVVTASPDHLTLPLHADGWSSAIVVDYSYTSIAGNEVESSLGQQLTDLSEGSRVGVSLDDSRNLLVHRDGVCLGIVTHSVPHPAYALFDLLQPWEYSVAALPTTSLK